MKESFSTRLQSIMQNGNLTGADLARWFERPDPTVRGWINGSHELGGAQLDMDFVETELVKLETSLRKRQGLPVPRLTPAKRIEYLAKLKRDL